MSIPAWIRGVRADKKNFGVGVRAKFRGPSGKFGFYLLVPLSSPRFPLTILPLLLPPPSRSPLHFPPTLPFPPTIP